MRTRVCDGLQAFGISIDEEKNDALANREGVISKGDSEMAVLVVHTNEMEEMARVATQFS